MSEEIDYAARVQRGIALLDVKWPTWATDVDLEKLDIESGEHCMTAQYARKDTDEWADWSDGMDSLGLVAETYEDRGFRASDGAEERAYPTLNGLWKAEIVKRRALDAPEASGR